MRVYKGLVLVTMVLAIATTSHAYTATSSSPALPVADTQYTEYYTIDEKNFDEQANKEWGFTEFTSELGPQNLIQAAKALILNLLKWTLHNEERPLPAENYIRKLHFGRWINDPTDDTCMNTRAKVLVRDSEDNVTFRNHRNCVVDTGRWTDPYSGRELMSSREIQIDHMVPLKHAYMSGAWKWDYKTRCLYANYLGYRNHLVPATVRENTSKGDRAPEKYLPSNENYRCQYVKDWLAIKLIWRLTLTSEEVQAINAVVTTYNCKVSDFKVPQDELAEQREIINANLDYCMLNKR